MSDPVLAFLDEVAETMILPHDLNATGCASMASIMDKIAKDGGIKARGLSAKAVSNRIRELVPTAEPCRKGIYVTQVKLDVDGLPEYPHQTYQRGLDFGDPHEFRKAVSKVTQRDYGEDSYWVRWQISVVIPKEEPWQADASDELESITR